MNWKSFAIFSPQAGLVTDVPSILLPSAATPDIQDMYFQSGEVKRYQKRIQLFSALPDPVLTQFTFSQDSEDREYFLYFTKRDVAYRDRNNDRYVFINPRIDAGTVSNVTELTGSTTQVDLSFDTGASISDVKAGDFIRIGDGTGIMTTDENWYEILEVLTGDSIVIDGVMETGYSVPTGGDSFVIRTTFSGDDEDVWVCDNASETLIATNNGIDYPIKWEGGTALIENLTEEFKCKWINYYAGRAIALNILANGSSYPVNIRWSGLLDFTDWGQVTGSDAGENSLIDGSGYIARGLVYRDSLYIIKSESFLKLWAVESDDIFNSKVLRIDLGTEAPHSFILYRDILYFYCTLDKSFRRFDGYYDQVISRDQDPTMKNITTSAEPLIRGYFVNEKRQLLWSVPYASSTTLNKILIADIDYAQSPWTIIDMVAYSFGSYEIGTDIYWDSLSYPDWASWNWKSWSSSEGSAGTMIDCCADENGYIHQMNASRLDNGTEYTSHIVFETDFSAKAGALPYYKRLLKLQIYCRDKGAGTVTVSIKRDLEESWNVDGTFNLNGGKEINVIDYPLDYRAKSFKIKLSSEYDFELIGIIAWFMPVGER